MNKNFTFDQNVFRILYLKYKSLVPPFLTIMICLLLFTQIIIPQIQELSLRKEEEINIRKKIETIKANINTLSTMNDKNIELTYRTVAFALPVEKDYEGVFRALSYAAGSSGVILNDYGFSVGDVSKKSIQQNLMSTIQLEIFVAGSFESVKKFIGKLSESFPLSELVSIDWGGNTARITAIFYYNKGFPKTIKINPDMNLSKLSESDIQMIKSISLWQPPALKNNFSSTFASSSGRRSDPF